MCSRPLQMLLTLTLLLAACKPHPQERKYHAVAGTAEHIDVETGVVRMNWVNTKTNQTRALTGTVTSETEIFINGLSAGLEDLRIGDRIVVTIYPVRDATEQWIVTRASIERDDSFLLTKSIPVVTPASNSIAHE